MIPKHIYRGIVTLPHLQWSCKPTNLIITIIIITLMVMPTWMVHLRLGCTFVIYKTVVLDNAQPQVVRLLGYASTVLDYHIILWLICSIVPSVLSEFTEKSDSMTKSCWAARFLLTGLYPVSCCHTGLWSAGFWDRIISCHNESLWSTVLVVE